MPLHFVIDTGFFVTEDTFLPKKDSGHIPKIDAGRRIPFISYSRLLEDILKDPEFFVYIPQCILNEIQKNSICLANYKQKTNRYSPDF